MNYIVLNEDEKNEILINTLLAQERDHFCYERNVERYTNLIPTLPEGEYKDKISALLITEQKALENTEATLAHTQAQLPSDANVLAEAIDKYKTKQLVQQGLLSPADNSTLATKII
jgi:hypothetical protein